MSSLSKVYLKAGKEKSVLRYHPWIFASAIERVDGEEKGGEIVAVYSHQGEWLAWGVFSPTSQIRIRLWSWDRDRPIDRSLIRDKLVKSIKLRKGLFHSQNTNCMRLVHAESDGLPGLIVDRYADHLVVQFLSWGVEKFRHLIVEELVDLTGIANIFERSDTEQRGLEGLQDEIGCLAGVEPPATIPVVENGLDFEVDLWKGHKTGFYLDQRLNRQRVMQYAMDKEVLDCFSYSGGMAIPVLLGGAKRVTCIENSVEALTLLRRNLSLNKIGEQKVKIVNGDVFQKLREFRDRGRSFDMVILDPPKFAPTVAHVSKASRGYKDINLFALKLLNRDGILVTFSCSGGVDLDLFQKIIFGAALDAGRQVRILEHLHQAPDHPIRLSFPEGAYLKGFILAVE